MNIVYERLDFKMEWSQEKRSITDQAEIFSFTGKCFERKSF